MIRIFNRYLSIRNTIYFVLENALLLLMWGTVIKGGWGRILLITLVFQVCLYYNELHPSFPKFSLKEFCIKYLRAIFWALGILFLIYLILPISQVSGNLFWTRLLYFPFILIALRLIYQGLSGSQAWESTLLIIGSGPLAESLKEILNYRRLGFRVLHFQWNFASPDALGEEWARLNQLVLDHKVKKVVVALTDRRRHLPVESLLNLRVRGVEVVEGVSFYEEISGKILVQSLRPSGLIFGKGFNRPNIGRIGKRVLDVILSLVGTILALPIFLILSILIKLESKGPIFYRQERMGEGGRPFMLIKFRSMRQDAEAASGPVWASENDPRVTRLGRIMRSFRLDEIPQMVNVLKGEMSFVGPRPERPVFVAQLRKKIPYYDLRFSVKPGLTGWAQVKYRYGSTEEDTMEKLQYDLYYIKHLSPFFDITILMETVQVILTGKGAR